MKNMPSLKSMFYLIKLHELQHFSRAAKACSITQSTLSIGIQTLEKQLGMPLLERQHKSFVFTETGEEVVKRCKKILMDVSEITDLARSDGKPFHGTLQLGCISTIAPFLLPKVVKQTQEKWSDLKLVITEDVSSQLLEKLHLGEIDVALLALPAKLKDMQSYSLGKERLQWVAHRKHVSPMQEPVNLNTIPNQSLFMLDKTHCLYDHIMQDAEKSHHQKINPNAFYDLSTLIQMTNTYQGITCLPQMALKSHILNHSDLEVIRQNTPALEREICLVWRPSSHRVHTLRALAALIEQQMRIL
tara:strand:- start:6657 stop:7562 length:906 start_codon:yes stop_codon:yes gene_type:complete